MRPTTWVLAGVAVVAAIVAAGGVAVTSGTTPATAAAQPPPAHTAHVERRSLSAMVSQPGTLTYRARPDGSPYSVINQARGTYTRLPVAGEVISQGHVLYRVNDRPVVLLSGSTPAYRTLSAGATGADVAELNADLVALGYATRGQLSRTSASFGSATRTAVKKLQAALGVSRNGTLTLGEAVFEPTAVRVTSVLAQPGGSARPGETVTQGTSTARQVQLALSAAQQTDVAVRDRVSITLPDNRSTPGVVASVGAVATCPSSSGTGGSGSSSAAPGTDSCSSGNSGSTTPTVTVDITPSDPAATGTWDQAPVQVGITTARVTRALVAPVTALLAQPGGGYAVEVVGAGARTHLVAVSLGLFDDADGLVAVTRLDAGRRPGTGGRLNMTHTPLPTPDHDPVAPGTGSGLPVGGTGVPVLDVDDVTKTYPGEPPVHALREVTLTIGPGELVGIVGPSGSGKTTLLQLMGTLDRPTSGHVRITGLDVATMADEDVAYLRATRIGFIFQQFFLAEHASVLDNVADGLLYAGIPLTQRRRRALDALELVGLAERPDARPTQLSGGQRQRVATARALVGQPAIVLADEPTGNLDQATGQSILTLIDELHQAGSTIVVITHDHAIAERMPRQVEIVDGRIVADSRPPGGDPS